MYLAQPETEDAVPEATTDGFDWFEGRSRGARSFATCSVTRSGSMTLNSAAVEVLEKPRAVRLGYRVQGRLIAIRGCATDERGAFRLRPSVRADGTQTGSFSIFVRGFLNYHGVDLDENHTYRLQEVSAGVFSLSLDDPLPRARSRQRSAS